MHTWQIQANGGWNDGWALRGGNKAASNFTIAQNQLEQFKATLEFYHKECEMKRNELDYLNSEIEKRKAFIQNLDNEDRYIRIKEDAKRETKLLMQKSQVIFAVTLTATLEAIRRYPNNDVLMSDIVTSSCYASTTPQQKPWLESHTPELLQLMQNVQNEIVEHISGIVINTIKSIPYKSHNNVVSTNVHNRNIIEMNH
jgi:cell division protein FtsB